MLLHDIHAVLQTVSCLDEDWRLQASLCLIRCMLQQLRSIDSAITLLAKALKHLLALIVLNLEVQTDITASCFCVDFREQVLEACLQTSFQEDTLEVIEL